MEVKELPDGRMLCVISKDELVREMTFTDRLCLDDDTFWFSALRFLTNEKFESSSVTVSLNGHNYEPELLYATLLYYFSKEQDIVERIGEFYEQEKQALDWWKAIPDSACSTRTQECGAAKIFDFYCKGVASAVVESSDPVKVLVAGSSGLEKSGVAVFALAHLLDVVAPGSSIDAYDPHELPSEFDVGSVKVKRVRAEYPLGEWRDYDTVLDDTYVTHIPTVSAWEISGPLRSDDRRSYACKSLKGHEQAYYSKDEKRYYSRYIESEQPRYCQGMDGCKNCEIISCTMGVMPCAPDLLFGLYVMCGVEPCTSLPGQKNMRALGEVIQNIWCGNSMDFRHFPPETGVEPYVRAAHLLKAMGLVEFRNDILYSRGVAYLKEKKIVSNRRNVMITNVHSVLPSARVHWSKYAPFAPTYQYPPSEADISVAEFMPESNVPIGIIPTHRPPPPGKVKLDVGRKLIMGGKEMAAYYRPVPVGSKVRGRRRDYELSKKMWLKYGVSAYCRTTIIDWANHEVVQRQRSKSCPANSNSRWHGAAIIGANFGD